MNSNLIIKSVSQFGQILFKLHAMLPNSMKHQSKLALVACAKQTLSCSMYMQKTLSCSI